ncbi:hypothetical protein ACVWVZ_005455 [Pseudomonas tolaasii]
MHLLLQFYLGLPQAIALLLQIFNLCVTLSQQLLQIGQPSLSILTRGKRLDRLLARPLRLYPCPRLLGHQRFTLTG